MITISNQFEYAVISVALFFILLTILEKWLSPNQNRVTNVYQGGEILANPELKYESELFYLAFIFLILHVIAFLSATMYILEKIGESIINWSTVTFLFLVVFFHFTVKGYKVS